MCFVQRMHTYELIHTMNIIGMLLQNVLIQLLSTVELTERLIETCQVVSCRHSY
jgi:hypothetical protein